MCVARQCTLCPYTVATTTVVLPPPTCTVAPMAFACRQVDTQRSGVSRLNTYSRSFRQSYYMCGKPRRCCTGLHIAMHCNTSSSNNHSLHTYAARIVYSRGHQGHRHSMYHRLGTSAADRYHHRCRHYKDWLKESRRCRGRVRYCRSYNPRVRCQGT